MDIWLVDIWYAHQRLIVAIGLILLALAYRQILWLCGVIVIPNDSIGAVTKKFGVFGTHRNLPDGSIIALSGEAGYQADTLTPGLQARWSMSCWRTSFAMAVRNEHSPTRKANRLAGGQGLGRSSRQPAAAAIRPVGVAGRHERSDKPGAGV